MADSPKLYRLLLKLYPAQFREEFAAPLERQFLDDHRESGGGFMFWVGAISDALTSIPREFAREFLQDLRYSARVYAKRPLVTFLAVAALALAIGATTGVFSVVNALLLRSLPFRAPERMVQLNAFPRGGFDGSAAFHKWRHENAYLEDAVLYNAAEVNLTRGGDALRINLSETSANFFPMIGATPMLGRSFAEGEDVAGRDSVAVISYALWQQLYGGDGRALGSTIHLNGTPITVIGVAPPAFDFPDHAAVWTPTTFDYERIQKSGAFWPRIGRLKAGLSLSQAESMYEAEVREIAPQLMNYKGPNHPALISMREKLAGPVRRASLVLFGAVLFVLLIACANVANLLLTRVAERRKELIVRASLGASRARLVQQLITESVLLSGISAIAGLGVAQWAARVAASAQPASIDAQVYTIVDWRVLAFTAGIAALTGVVFGILPAWFASRLQPSEDVVRQNGAELPGAARFRGTLIAVQVSLTLILLAGSVTMGRSFLKLLGTDLGYRTNNVVTMNVSLAGTRYQKEGRMRQYYGGALARLRAIPGVESAGAVSFLPLETHMFMGGTFHLDSGTQLPLAVIVHATPDYLRAMGATIVAGRDFNTNDIMGADRVAIIDETLAQAAGGGALIGRKIDLSWKGAPQWVTIIGISRPIRYGASSDPQPLVTLAASQSPYNFMTFVARVNGPPEKYLAVARDAIRSMDPEVPVFSTMTLDQRLAENLARPRFYTTAVLFFGGFAMLLAIIGIYGVASYAITQRRHEIGVRIAVGAPSQSVRAMLARQGMTPVAIGTVAGVCAAIALRRFLEHLLDTGGETGAQPFLAAAVVLALVAGATSWFATRRVTRMNPIEILRSE